MIEDNLEGWDFAPEPTVQTTTNEQDLAGWDFAPEPTSAIEETENFTAKEEQGVLDYVLTPNEPAKQTKAFQQGQAYVTQKAEPVVPTEAPQMEGYNSFMEKFLGRKYSVDEVNQFMGYQMSQGKTKQEALKELEKIGATPTDLRNAVRYGTSTKAPTAAATDIAGNSAKRGLARVGLAVAQTSVDIASTIGVDTTQEQQALDFARGQISKEQEQMKETYGMDSPVEQVVRYTPELLSFFIGGSAKTVFGLEAMTEYALSRADGFDKGQSLTRGVTVGIIAGGAQKLVDGVSTVNKDGLTEEAETVLEYMQVKKGSPEYKALKESLKGVDPDDQARILAEQGGVTTEGMFGQALKQVDDKTKAKYAKLLANTRKEYANATGLDDFDGIEKATKAQYQAMRQAIKDMSMDNVYNVDELAVQLEKFVPYARNDASANKIMRMIEQIRDKPTKSLDEIMDLRQEINYEYGKTTNATAKKMLSEMKAHVDNYFRNSDLAPSVYNMMEESITSYNRMMSQKELLELVNKNTITKGQGSAIGEIKVVNWGKLAEDVEQAGLGKVVADEIKLIEKLAKKYGSFQADLLGGTRTKGTTAGLEDLPTALLAAHTGSTKVPLFKKMEDILLSWIPTEGGKAVRVQNAIAKSLEKSKSYREFAENIVKDKNIPANIKAKTQKMLDETAEVVAESHKAPATRAESQKIQEKAQQMKVGVDSAENSAVAADQRYQRLVKYNESLERRLDKALESGDYDEVNAIESALASNKVQMEIALKRKDVAHRNYTNKRTQYEKFADRYRQWLQDSEDFGEGLRPATMPSRADGPVPATKDFPRVDEPIPRERPPETPESPVTPTGSSKGSFTGGGIQKSEDFRPDTAMPTREFELVRTEDGEIRINRPYADGETATGLIRNAEGKDRSTAAVANTDSYLGRTTGTRLTGDEINQALDTNDSAIKALEQYLPELEAKFGKPYADLAKSIIKDNPQLAVHIKNTQNPYLFRTARGYVGGSSDSVQGTVKLPKGAQGTAEGASTFLHEIVHQATVNRYYEDEVFRAGVDKLFEYAKSQSKTGEFGRGGGYWKSDPKEMLAEAFSNPKAQRELMEMPTPKWFREKYPRLSNIVKTAWDAFVYLVTGASTKKIPDDNVLKAMGDLLASNVNRVPMGTAKNDIDRLIRAGMNTRPYKLPKSNNSFIQAGIKNKGK